MAPSASGDGTIPSVVVTGTSSGIGRATALRLADAGIRVFAACRRLSDGDTLAAQASRSELIVPLLMDVTDPETVHLARATIEAAVGPRGLFGLVNNAGVGLATPVETADLARVRNVFEVNVFGQLTVIQSFLPLLRTGPGKPVPGRMVNVGSVGAHITIPFGGALCGSKAAFTAFNDALRLELHSQGIKVCVIEPGSISTPAVDKTLGDAEGTIAGWSAPFQEMYGTMFRNFSARAAKREATGSAPDVVAVAIHHALTSGRPRPRYTVGQDARLLTILPRILPTALLDTLRLRLFGIG